MAKLQHHSLVVWQRADDLFINLHLLARKDRLHFFNIAEASLSEVGYCVHVARRLGYITNDTVEKLECQIRGVGAPLIGLIRSTRSMPNVVPPA